MSSDLCCQEMPLPDSVALRQRLVILIMIDLSEPHLTGFGPLKAESCTRALASDAPPPSRRPLAALRVAALSRAQRRDGQVLPARVAVDAQLKTRHAPGQLRVTTDRHSG